jgi:hypothetical protein
MARARSLPALAVASNFLVASYTTLWDTAFLPWHRCVLIHCSIDRKHCVFDRFDHRPTSLPKVAILFEEAKRYIDQLHHVIDEVRSVSPLRLYIIAGGSKRSNDICPKLRRHIVCSLVHPFDRDQSYP